MRQKTILVVHPSAELYGSDLQLLESVTALVAEGYLVVVITPTDGELQEYLRSRGARTLTMHFPVLRRMNRNPLRLGGLLADVVRFLPQGVKTVRYFRASAIYINTVTIPWWGIVAKLSGRPAICHVHEAESAAGRPSRLVLYAPLLMTCRIIAISSAAARTLVDTVPRLAERTVVVRNGVPGRELPAKPFAPTGTFRLAVVARLSPRKGTMDALEATAKLRRDGADVELHLYGGAFSGYEWYENQLRSRATSSDLDGAVFFHGHIRPVWQAYDDADVVLAPSRVEPYGNSVVEAQYSGRPVIASDAEGHLESITNDKTGLIHRAGDSAGLAVAIQTLIDDHDRARALASAAQLEARTRNSVEFYHRRVADIVGQQIG